MNYIIGKKKNNKIQVLHASVVEWLRFIIINCLIWPGNRPDIYTE